MKKEKPLSAPQQMIYDFVVAFQLERGYPPSVREICKGVGLSSTSTVHGHLTRLERKGFLQRDPSKPRAVAIPALQNQRRGQVSLPIVGRVTAGQPILAQEDIQGYIALPTGFVGTEGAFVLTVRGESMVDAGIMNGDNIIVEPSPNAENGEIVVAMLPDEITGEDSATVKRFYKEENRIRLQPENSSMDPIYCSEVTIIGKVVGLLRHF